MSPAKLAPKDIAQLRIIAEQLKPPVRSGIASRRGVLLFAGDRGAIAADALAKELRLALYRVELSAVVSKYVGDTEKNIDRVFEAAGDGTVLLIDEADALFGKRSDVKDSHDRYANLQADELLRRFESFDGLMILATKLEQNIDAAFLRRLRRYEFPPKP